jgi:hypothetical protein
MVKLDPRYVTSVLIAAITFMFLGAMALPLVCACVESLGVSNQLHNFNRSLRRHWIRFRPTRGRSVPFHQVKDSLNQELER